MPGGQRGADHESKSSSANANERAQGPRAAPAAAPSASHPDYTQRVTFTFMIGVYLAVNAVRDLFLLVEGPDCTYMKTQYVQGNHDWLSTLTSVSGLHRIANTALHPVHMSGTRERSLRDALARMAASDGVPAVALTSMPMAFVTGADYQRLTRDVSLAARKPVLHIPGKSLSGDWIDGYAEALVSLATQLDLSGGSPRPGAVAVVGYLYDRNEADHVANLRELRRMHEAVGLDLVSVWLSGQAFADLRAVRDASVILALPYGRRAAAQIAKRTGARVVAMDLPFGFGASEAWIRKLGEISGRLPAAERFLHRELSEVAPKLEWVIPFLFQNRSFGYVGDPFLLPGFLDIVEIVGGRTSFAVVSNRPQHARGLAETFPGLDLLVYPKMKGMLRFLVGVAAREPVQLLVANNAGILGTDGAILEFGFPSMFRHALYDRPFLGLSGALCFVDSMANAMRAHEIELTQRNVALALPRLGHR
jgi:nitrogenase molybdenum-iron protein alpha/beta subunit